MSADRTVPKITAKRNFRKIKKSYQSGLLQSFDSVSIDAC